MFRSKWIFKAILTISIFALLSTSLVAATTPQDVSEYLKNKMPQSEVTQEEFIRLMPAILGFGSEVSMDDPIENHISLLKEVGAFPGDYQFDPEEPATKQWASVILVEALDIKPGLVELAQIKFKGGISQAPDIAFKMAERSGIISPYNPESVLSGRSLAAMALALSEKAQESPLQNADTAAIEDIAISISSEVITQSEANEVIPRMQVIPTS